MFLKNYKLTNQGKLYHNKLNKKYFDNEIFEDNEKQYYGKELSEEKIIKLLLEDGFIELK